MKYIKIYILLIISSFTIFYCANNNSYQENNCINNQPITAHWLQEAIEDMAIHPRFNYSSDFNSSSFWYYFSVPDEYYHNKCPYYHDMFYAIIKDSFASSSSPWWIDPNHRSPGAGYLQLVFISFSKYLYNYPHIDMTNAIVTITLRGNSYDAKSAKLLWWIQGYSHTINLSSNHALNNPINLTNDWNTVQLTLSPAADWIALGSCTELEDEYGIAEISEILQRTYDFGLILIPVDPENQPEGIIQINDIVIE